LRLARMDVRPEARRASGAARLRDGLHPTQGGLGGDPALVLGRGAGGQARRLLHTPHQAEDGRGLRQPLPALLLERWAPGLADWPRTRGAGRAAPGPAPTGSGGYSLGAGGPPLRAPGPAPECAGLPARRARIAWAVNTRQRFHAATREASH